MIEITSLNKTYYTKKEDCHALKDVNLVLPNNGVVFILGKSGSGKSTLLNLIGGLDTATKGKIIVDGNDLSTFKENDFCNYRNNHIGFIFQDYHLIDDLTVSENIALSLDMKRQDDMDLVKKALEKVDLAGYENRFPLELSGGERQRVAIARAIVKNPKIILADEPTGNLDIQTSKQIIDLLKSLSEECLVLIVSHNINDAKQNANRIIELASGSVIADNTKNLEYIDSAVYESNTIYIPGDKPLHDEDIDVINANMSDSVKLVKSANKFIPTKENITDRVIAIEKTSLSFKKEVQLAIKFLRTKSLRILLSSFMVALIMIIFALAETIITFDSTRLILDEANKQQMNSMYFTKVIEGVNTDYSSNLFCRVEIDKDDIDSFKNGGFKDDIYPVYNPTIATIYNFNYSGFFHSNLATGYIVESLGTLVVDEEFLISKFGEIKYEAKVDDFALEGIIITDYMADSILASNNRYNNYQDLLGYYNLPNYTMPMNYINAIIDTGYEKKYEVLLEKIANKEYANKQELYQDDEFKKLSNEIYDRYGYCYSLNPNFSQDYQDDFAWRYPYTQKIVVNDLKVLDHSTTDRQSFVWGVSDPSYKKIGIGAYYYTTSSPKVPHGAKYIKIQYGGMQTNITQEDNPIAYRLKENGIPIIEFSDGSTPGEKLAQGDKSCWLNTNGTLRQQTSHPNSLVTDFIEIPDGCTISKFETYSVLGYALCCFYDKNKDFISAFDYYSRVPINDGEIYMGISRYNELFGTSWTEDNKDLFIPHKVKLTQYRYSDEALKNPLVSIEVTISKLVSGHTIVADDVAKALSANQVFATGLYFNGIDGMVSAIKMMDELAYEYQCIEIEAISTMSKAVEIFIPVFKLVVIFLSIGVVFVLTSFSVRMISSKKHDIGILKALGSKNKTIAMIFGLQVGLIGIATCILSTLGYFIFIGFANDVLVASLKSLAVERVVLDLDFLTFDIFIALINCGIVMLLTLFSLVLPILKIRNIEPVKIIRVKE